jgi:hypothetical protein
MKVRWLIEPEVFQGDTFELEETLSSQRAHCTLWKFGMPYADCHRVFKGEEGPVVFLGSMQFAEIVKRITTWYPGVYGNLGKMYCSYYYPRFGKELFNSNYVLIPYGDIIRRKEWLFSNIGSTARNIFVRPDSSEKSFTGQVVNSGDFERRMKILGSKLDPEDLIVVATAQVVKREWRTVVCKNKVVASCQYKEDGDSMRDRDCPAHVVEYAQSVLDKVTYKPDPIWVMDICETSDETLKVLEVGTFSCSGLYACDPVRIIEAVESLVQDTVSLQ